MIRQANPADFEFIYGLYMHPQVNPFLLYESMGKTAFQPIYEELLRDGVKFLFLEENHPAGMFKLIPLRYRTHHVVYLGGLAIHPDHSGRGSGARMLGEILDFCRERGFLRVELSVAVNNEKAIRLYKRAGFAEEGRLRKYSHLASRGEYWDEYLMSFLFAFPGHKDGPKEIKE
jgi:L-phenylalanine/L-methionine N-acetyltransferase